MNNFIVFFWGINSITFVVGDYYDITTVYRFNTEEVYDNGEVITKYLNTCAVSVHPQTNAINLPFINLDNTQTVDKIHYPLSSPRITPLHIPFESFQWKTLSSTDGVELLEDPLTDKLRNFENLENLLNEEAFFGFFENSTLHRDVQINGTCHNGCYHGSIYKGTDMEFINRWENKFIYLNIENLQGGNMVLSFQSNLDSSSQQYIIDVSIDTSNKITVCPRSTIIYDYEEPLPCYEYTVQNDHFNQVLIFINLDDFSFYDAIGHKAYPSKLSKEIIEYIIKNKLSSTSYVFKNKLSSTIYVLNSVRERERSERDREGEREYCKLTTKIIQIPKLPRDKNIFVSSDKENNTILLVTYTKNHSDAKIISYIKEQGTNHTIQLETKDLIKLSTNQSDINEAIVTKVNVNFPENWTGEKQIHIKAEKHIYITDVWEGGNLDFYAIRENEMCTKGNIKEIYGVIFREPMTNQSNNSVKSCLNGGILISSKNTCTCPPGFTGYICEIACGRNYFGQQCSQMCTNSDNECKGMILCTTTYGCSCAPGYRGDQCLEECEDGYYGADCTQNCGKCKGICDKYTGDCKECVSTYIVWPSCSQNHSYWKEYPAVEDSTYTSIKLSLDFNPHNIEKAADFTKFYLVQYKEDSDTVWNNCSFRPFKGERISHVVQKLKPGRRYSLRVLLVDKSFRTNDPELSQSTIGITKCIVSKTNNNLNATAITNTSIALIWKKEANKIVDNECPFSSYTLEIDGIWKSRSETRKIFNITENTIDVKTLIPGNTYLIKLKKNTVHGESIPASDIQVTTSATTDNTMSVAGVKTKISGSSIYLEWFKNPLYKTYYVKYKLTRRLSCSLDEIDSPLQVIPTTSTTYTLSLEPYAQYQIFVTIDQSQEVSLKNFTEVTDGELPNISPILPNRKFGITNESVQLYWADPPSSCLHMNGFFEKYSVQLMDTYNTTLNSYETIDRVLEISGLTPKTDYKLKVRYDNHIGSSPIYSEYSFRTKATSFLQADEITAYKMNAHSIGLRWKISDTNSTVTGIAVSVQGQTERKSLNITNLDELKCNAWPSYLCYNITQLKQNTKYTFSVVIYSEEFPEGGLRKTIHAVTRETAPSAVSDIKLEGVAKKNMNITWKIPFFLNGTLRKFLIEIEHLSSFEEALCCQGITTITHMVNEEKEIYSHVIENILEASSYQVTIRAFTKRLGQETSKIIDIAPSLIPIEQIPEVKVDGKEVDWKNFTDNPSSRHELVTDLLIIVESNDKETNTVETSKLSTEVGHYFTSNWWLAHVCKVNEHCAVTIGTGEESDSIYGKVINKPLTAGRNYKIVLAQVNKYLSARSYTITKSAPFMRKLTSTTTPLSTRTEESIPSTTEYVSSELFTTTETMPTIILENISTEATETIINENIEEEYDTDD